MGIAIVRGSQTTRYRKTVGKALIDAWVGEDGRLHQIRERQTIPVGHETTTVELFDFGAPRPVVDPSASSVYTETS
jgi:hypothetical protein